MSINFSPIKNPEHIQAKACIFLKNFLPCCTYYPFSIIIRYSFFKKGMMYIIRDIFHLHFGHYRDAKALVDEAMRKNTMPQAKSLRLLTDFTGDSYRLIFESGYDSLADYERSLTGAMAPTEWKKW